MSLNQIHHLKLSWSVSRGRDTFGYNIARLDDTKESKRYRTCGGGYDMVGTVFADWLEDVFQSELLKLSNRAYYIAKNNSLNTSTDCNSFYGMYFYPETNKIKLDGGCGLDSILKIVDAIGLEYEREYIKTGKNRGQTIGYFVQMKSL